MYNTYDNDVMVHGEKNVAKLIRVSGRGQLHVTLRGNCLVQIDLNIRLRVHS